jgi:hypothetical protein
MAAATLLPWSISQLPDGFCHASLFGEPSKRQGFRAFLPD